MDDKVTSEHEVESSIFTILAQTLQSSHKLNCRCAANEIRSKRSYTGSRDSINDNMWWTSVLLDVIANVGVKATESCCEWTKMTINFATTVAG